MPSTDDGDDKANETEKNNQNDGTEPDYFEFEFSLKRLDYKKYLVGTSTENFLAFCGCDDSADVADSSTINQTAHAYRRYIFHLCRDMNLNTDQVVKKFKKLGVFSWELEDIIKQKCTKLRAEINRKYYRNGKTIMKSGQKVAMFIFAWEKFCRANGIKMYWDEIRGIIPKKQMRKAALDEAYTHEQIKRMIPYVTDLRIKVAIHFMASGGLRREAMTTLLDKHVSPVEIDGKLVCAKVITYNEEEGTYITFVTPEAYNLYLEYKEQRKHYGEVFDGSGNNPVIIEKFNIWKPFALKDKLIEPITPPSLDRVVSAVLVAARVRERSDAYTHRYKVKCLHGFRSFFYETLKKVRKFDGKTQAIPTELCHALLGDKTINPNAQQDASYDKKTDQAFNERELLEAYFLAVPDLTIGDEARERALKEKAQDELKDTKTLKIELEKVKQDKSQESQEVQDLKHEVRQLREMMVAISKSGATGTDGSVSDQVVGHNNIEYYDATDSKLTEKEIDDILNNDILNGEISTRLPKIQKSKFQLVPKDEYEAFQKSHRSWEELGAKLYNTTPDKIRKLAVIWRHEKDKKKGQQGLILINGHCARLILSTLWYRR